MEKHREKIEINEYQTSESPYKNWRIVRLVYKAQYVAINPDNPNELDLNFISNSKKKVKHYIDRQIENAGRKE